MPREAMGFSSGASADLAPRWFFDRKIMISGEKNLRLFVRAEHELAEGPLWLRERWWWVDIEAGSVNSCDAAGRRLRSRSFGRRVVAVASAGNDDLLVVFERTITRWNPSADSLREIASLGSSEPQDNRFNDGKLDPAGRLVIGTLSKKGLRGTAALYSLDRSHRLIPLLAGLHLSNGLAWSSDGGRFFHVDSLAREITAYDYDLNTGCLSNRRVAIRVPPEMGLPDGIDMDGRGRLWVAHWDGRSVCCWSPDDGRCLARIPVPCSRPTSCKVGGFQGDELFITTARIGLSESEMKSQPLAGSLFHLSLARISEHLGHGDIHRQD